MDLEAVRKVPGLPDEGFQAGLEKRMSHFPRLSWGKLQPAAHICTCTTFSVAWMRWVRTSGERAQVPQLPVASLTAQVTFSQVCNCVCFGLLSYFDRRILVDGLFMKIVKHHKRQSRLVHPDSGQDLTHLLLSHVHVYTRTLTHIFNYLFPSFLPFFYAKIPGLLLPLLTFICIFSKNELQQSL